MDKLPEAIRRAAKKKKIPLETLRKTAGLSNSLFYGALKGEMPKKVATINTVIEKLRAAGVVIPRQRRTLAAAA